MSSRAVLLLFALCGLAATVSSRSIDPLITILALDFAIPITTAALVSSLYALPFALAQPVLGPLGDAFGKTLMLRIYLWILSLCLLGAALAPTFESLLLMRFCSGVAAGGIIPACMASLGDRFDGAERTVAISRFVTVGLMAQIFSASLSGLLASQLGWRSVFFAAAVIACASALLATVFLKIPKTSPVGFSMAGAVRNYRTVFANPKAPLCFGTVFLEGIALFGITPYVAELLRDRGLGDVRQAGLIIGAMGIGGIIYSLVLPLLLRHTTRFVLLRAGGLVAAFGPLTLAFATHWILIAIGFAVAGFGYMLMHNSIQSEAVELAPGSRVSAYSMHAFSFFIGQSLGPILCGWALHGAGPSSMLIGCAAVLALTGLGMARGFVRLTRPGT